MVGKRRGDLEGAPDAEPPDRARLAADRFLAEQRDPAAVRRVLPVEHVEAGALAGAVGADQRQISPARSSNDTLRTHARRHRTC
jgi:hypothetical protein